MKKLFLLFLLLGVFSSSLFAENNSSKSTGGNSDDQNVSTKQNVVDKQVQEQMKREEKYAREQAFYQGSDYNLSEHEVDPKSLESITVPEPQYDFDMDDVYSD